MSSKERDEPLLAGPGESRGVHQPEGDPLRGPRPETEAPLRAEPLGPGVEPEQLPGRGGPNAEAESLLEPWREVSNELALGEARVLGHLIYTGIVERGSAAVMNEASRESGIAHTFRVPMSAYVRVFARTFGLDPERTQAMSRLACAEVSRLFLDGFARLRDEEREAAADLESARQSAERIATLGLETPVIDHSNLIRVARSAKIAQLVWPRG